LFVEAADCREKREDCDEDGVSVALVVVGDVGGLEWK
jgi:hypothetical protein